MEMPVQIAPVSHGTTSTQGTSVAGGSGAGTYTATKVQLVAATSEDWSGILALTSEGTTIGSLWKLYVGGSGSEQEFVEFVGSNGPVEPMNMLIPIKVPAGSRISVAKADSNGFASTARIHLTPIRGKSTNPLVSRGRLIGKGSGALTDVDAGGTANTKGSWVQLSASIPQDAKGFTLVGFGDSSNDSNTRYHIDVGVGGAGSEQVILADISTAGEEYRVGLRGLPLGPIWTPIPAGSRIAVRCQCSSATAAVRVPRLAMILWE